MQGLAYPSSSAPQDQAALKSVRKQREKKLKGMGMQTKLAEESMSEREMDHAIKVTEERLEDLKAAVHKRKASKPGEAASGSAHAGQMTDEAA